MYEVLLLIIIVLAVLGAIAFFVLGAFRPWEGLGELIPSLPSFQLPLIGLPIRPTGDQQKKEELISLVESGKWDVSFAGDTEKGYAYVASAKPFSQEFALALQGQAETLIKRKSGEFKGTYNEYLALPSTIRQYYKVPSFS